MLGGGERGGELQCVIHLPLTPPKNLFSPYLIFPPRKPCDFICFFSACIKLIAQLNSCS